MIMNLSINIVLCFAAVVGSHIVVALLCFLFLWIFNRDCFKNGPFDEIGNQWY